MLVITSCSSTKSAPAPRVLKASTYQTKHLDSFARLWVKHVHAQSERRIARVLYGGASVAAARRAAETLGGTLYFVSAGMSLVSSEAQIPSYDLTVAARSESMPSPMRNGSVTAASWWAALNNAMGTSNPFKEILNKVDGLVVLALPKAYLRMIEQDLLGLSASALKRLRIITVGEVSLSPKLQDQVISYDARMDQLPGIPGGTRSSAVQRALLDFSQRQATRPKTTNIDRQRTWVMAALNELKAKPRPMRKSVSDATVAQWILENDPQRIHSVSRLLREFRAAGFACEQGRFARIAHITSSSK